jgi:hypothetical protein
VALWVEGEEWRRLKVRDGRSLARLSVPLPLPVIPLSQSLSRLSPVAVALSLSPVALSPFSDRPGGLSYFGLKPFAG